MSFPGMNCPRPLKTDMSQDTLPSLPNQALGKYWSNVSFLSVTKVPALFSWLFYIEEHQQQNDLSKQLRNEKTFQNLPSNDTNSQPWNWTQLKRRMKHQCLVILTGPNKAYVFKLLKGETPDMETFLSRSSDGRHRERDTAISLGQKVNENGKEAMSSLMSPAASSPDVLISQRPVLRSSYLSSRHSGRPES